MPPHAASYVVNLGECLGEVLPTLVLIFLPSNARFAQGMVINLKVSEAMRCNDFLCCCGMRSKQASVDAKGRLVTSCSNDL